MNFKTTLILIVLLAAVGLYLLVDHWKTPNPSVEQAVEQTGLSGEGTRLFEADAKDVNKVQITPADGSKLVMQKSDGHWQITEPVSALADPFETDDFVRSLVELRTRGQIDPTGDKAAATGLDHPAWRVELSLESGQTIQFTIGARAAIGDAMYIQVQGQQQAQIVPADLWPKLQNPADQLRDKRLVTATATDIHQLRIQTPNTNFQLQKEGDQWKLTNLTHPPTDMPAESSAVSDLLFDITGLRADGFVPPDSPESSRARFDHPQATVHFSAALPSTLPTSQPTTTPTGITLTFGNYENSLRDKVYVKLSNSNTIAKVPAAALTTLLKKPLDLRDKRAVEIDPAKVSQISLTIDHPATTQPTTRPATLRTITIHRRPQSHQPTTTPATTQSTTQPASHWLLTSESDVPADDANVEALLSALHPLKAQRYLESPPTPQPADTYTLVIETTQAGGAGQSSYTIHLIEPNATDPLIGSYNGLTFEADRELLSKLQADFRAPAPATTRSQ
ncbi:MAG: DUF4340 domain-containing protein [Phycisphaerales bacterium]|nr:DUF4340 domain-containing protein [Phycisphaerales bacterium]